MKKTIKKLPLNKNLEDFEYEEEIEYESNKENDLKSLYHILLEKEEKLEKEKNLADGEEIPEKEIDKMNEYKELLEKNLFEETFILLEVKVKAIEDNIEKSKYVSDFFKIISDHKFFSTFLEDPSDPENLGKRIYSARTSNFINTVYNNLNEKEYLKSILPRLDSFLDEGQIGIFFMVFAREKNYEKARSLKKFVDYPLMDFPNFIKTTIENDDIDGLNFLCENTRNIHEYNGELLNLSSKMSPKALKMLIEKYEFNLNDCSKVTGLNLIHTLILDKNIKSYNFIIKNYFDKINLGIKTQAPKHVYHENLEAIYAFPNKGNQDKSMFNLIKNSKLMAEFLTPLLEQPRLKNSIMQEIGEIIFSASPEVVERCGQTQLYAKYFSHVHFDPTMINLGSGHFLYGLINRINSKLEDKDFAKFHLDILSDYIENHSEPDVPDALEYHILGGAVALHSKTQSPHTLDAILFIMKRYPQYINKANPNGILPLAQVSKDTQIYRLLLNHGAVPLEPEPGFWKAFFNGKKDKSVAKIISKDNEKSQENIMPPKNSNVALRKKIRKEIMDLREKLDNNLIDSVIKIKCENLFLKTDQLLIKSAKFNVEISGDELHFINSNISNYLTKIIDNHIKSALITNDIDSIENHAHLATSDLELKRKEKIELNNKQCLKNIAILESQINLITKNFSDQMHEDSAREDRILDNFFEQKFATSENVVSIKKKP